MANICTTSIKIVGKTEQSVKDLIKVFGHTHPQYFLYRSDLCKVGSMEKEDGFFTATVDVDVANTARFMLRDGTERVVKYGDTAYVPKDHPAYNATMTSLTEVCRALDVGVEIWGEEGGCCFQEHMIIDHKGNEVENDRVEWHPECEDEDGNTIEEDGGYDWFGEFDDAIRIYHSEMEEDGEDDE